MYPNAIKQHLSVELEQLQAAGLFKQEHIILSPQSGAVRVESGKVINLCSNNYLGLANHPSLIAAAKSTLDTHGFGLSSVRFICGTQDLHKNLESRLADFLGTDDCILFSSCFDANGGLFECLFTEQDAIISDELNHASIIDGIRLAKAKRYRYRNNNMQDLEDQLKQAKEARYRVIATDGVFSMDGTIANLRAICDLADKYEALVMVDDSHAVGFMGAQGRGTPEHCQVMDRIDIITGTMGKALGGASGGYVAGRKEIVAWLRQRSRPYLFSNTVAPAICGATIEVLDLLKSSGASLRVKLQENAQYFRNAMVKLGFQLTPGEHPIIPVMLGDAKLARDFASRMFELGVYVVGFSYPVVPMGKARIRTQMSAALDRSDLDFAIKCFAQVGRELKLID
jgi:glycine C-acetyltransferase